MNYQVLSAMSIVEPVDEYQGIKFFNICHIIDALETAGLTNWIWNTKEELNQRNELILESVEVLDAVVYSYPKWECNYGDAIRLALENSVYNVVLEDLS